MQSVSANGYWFRGIFIFFFSILSIISNHSHVGSYTASFIQSSLVLQQVFLLRIRICSTFFCTFSRRLLTLACLQRIWFRKWYMLHTIWNIPLLLNHFEFFMWTKGTRNQLPHNFALLRHYPYFALAIYCIYFLSHRIPDKITFKPSNFKKYFFSL